MSLVVSPLELGDSNGWVASALERMRLLSNVINMKINLQSTLSAGTLQENLHAS